MEASSFDYRFKVDGDVHADYAKFDPQFNDLDEGHSVNIKVMDTDK